MNILKTTIWTGIALSSIAMLFSVACTKNTSGNTVPAGRQRINVYLNDDPVPNLTDVLVDIRYVEVKVDTGTIHHDDDYYDDDHEGDENEGAEDGQGEDRHRGDHFGQWDTLNIRPGLYDLLKLKNGVDTLLASGTAFAGKVTRIRITLGTAGSVVVDSTHTYPLTICDGDPYVYVRVPSNAIDTVGGGHIRIRLDFDIARSIEYEDGHYCLHPKLCSYSDDNTGRIEGEVGPAQAHAWVMAVNGTDTAYAMPEDDGEFQLRGLKPATYSVLFKAAPPYRDSTINNVQVHAGDDTHLPSVVLHQ